MCQRNMTSGESIFHIDDKNDEEKITHGLLLYDCEFILFPK